MADLDSNRDITPDTTVAKLLKSFPELESMLVTLSPAFSKLRNPVLRNTVAKITTLRQAAKIGNVPLAKLINTLRQEAGLAETNNLQGEVEMGFEEKPEWVDKLKLKKTFDARSLIESGGHPLNQVLEDLDTLEEDESYKLITPFLPAPLIEVAENRGYYSWSFKDSEEQFSTWFSRMLE